MCVYQEQPDHNRIDLVQSQLKLTILEEGEFYTRTGYEFESEWNSV